MSLSNVITTDFFHHYQPIYDIQDWKVVGYEGLFRTGELMDPEITFTRARNKKKLYELDSRSVHKALITYINAGYTLRDEKLFLNVFPSTLINPLFHTLVSKIINEKGVSSQQIILEINENEIMDFEAFKRGIFHLKKLGFRFGLDDFGQGFSSMKSIIELQPDYVKLDRYFMEGIRASSQKKDIVRFLYQFCKEFNSHLVVEGIEDMESLDIIKQIGVQYAQGYFLGKPALLPESEGC